MFEKDRHSCLVTRALLRYLLSVCTGLDANGFGFEENSFGKPDLKPGLTDYSIKFNLSHSSGITACALVLERDIGIDVENNTRKIELDLADRYFSKPESDYLKTCPKGRRQKGYFDFWTLKESYIKARGKGLSIGLDKFSFDIAKEKIGIRFHESLNDSPEQWQFFKFSPEKDITASISLLADNDNPYTLAIYNCIPFKGFQKKENIKIMA